MLCKAQLRKIGSLAWTTRYECALTLHKIVSTMHQGFVKGEVFCFRYLDFYFQHGESTSTASQLTSPASQKSKDLNKVPLLLQDLGHHPYFREKHSLAHIDTFHDKIEALNSDFFHKKNSI